MRNSIIIIILFLFINTKAEDIVGFNFGGVFKDANKYEEITVGKKLLPHEYVVENVKFFDFAQVGTDTNKIIKCLTFQKSYNVSLLNLKVEKVKIKSDYKRMLESIEKRYGTFDNKSAENILGTMGDMNGFYIQKINESSVNKNPKSDHIGFIMLILQSENEEQFAQGQEKKITLSLAYMDKSLYQKINNDKNDDTSGF